MYRTFPAELPLPHGPVRGVHSRRRVKMQQHDKTDRDRDRDRDGEGERLAAARDYTRRGWRVTPLMPGGKAPTLAGWQRRWLGEDELARHFAGEANVGLLLGEPSGGLVDVDCDAAEAVAAAPFLLPATGRVSGRAGKPPNPHWFNPEGALSVAAEVPGNRGRRTGNA